MTISKQVAGVNAAEPGLYPDQYNCDYSLAVDYTVSRNSVGRMVVTVNTVRLYSYLQWYLQNVVGTSTYFGPANVKVGIGTPPYNTPNIGQGTYNPSTNYDCYSAAGAKVVDNTTPANSSPGWAYFTFKGTKPAWVINSDYDVTDTSKTQSLVFYIEIRDGEVGYLYKVNIPFSVTLEPNRWTVSYNANGGSGAPASQAKAYGSNLTLSSTIPTRTNYVFNDWTTKSDGTGTHYQKGGTYSTNATATLYAQWFPPNYITFYANGGTGGPSQITKTHGVNVTIPNTIPTRTNYVFIDWTTNEDGTGTHYQRGATYSANADANLYAQWHAPHNVSYDANGGANAPAAQVKVYGQNLTLATAKPTRAGWNFKNWNTAQSGSGGTAYNPGATYTNEADLKLYAQWERWVTGVSITDLTAKRVADGSSTSESDEGTYAYVTASFNVKGAAAASMTVSMTCTKDGTSVTVPVTLSQSTFTKAAANDDASAPFTLTARASGLATDSKYTFAMTVATTNTSATQSIASQTRSAVLPTAYYTIDVLHGGHGIAFGKAATTAELMDVGYDVNVDGIAKINGDRLTTTGGRVTGYPTYGSGHLRLFSNGIAFKDPLNNSSSSGNSDFGWIRMVEETANSGYLEIATGDDGNEPIYVRQYNTSNAVAREVKLLDEHGRTKFPIVVDVGTGEYSPFSVEFFPGGSAGHGGYIDFHYNGLSADYTARIIEDSSGVLNVIGALKQNGTAVSLNGHTHTYAGSSSAGGSANSAVMLDGFASRATSMGWGNQTGTVITSFNDSTGGSIGWRRDNPSSGQMSMVIDGTVYVNEGRYAVLNTNNWSSYCAAASHSHSISQVSWPAPDNLTTSATANGQEWSIDLSPGSYTGTYWHVWSTPRSASILQCWTDTRRVVVPANYLTFRAVLYNNSSGTSSNITLSSSAANFNHMRIYWYDTGMGRNSLDIYDPNGKTFNAMAAEVNRTSGTKFWLDTQFYQINGTSMSYQSGRWGQFWCNGTDSGVSNTDAIRIVRVEGWNE